jgi:chromosome segregation ATPase
MTRTLLGRVLAAAMLAGLLVGCGRDARIEKRLRRAEAERTRLAAELEKSREEQAAQRRYVVETTEVLNEVQDSLASLRRDELKIVRISLSASREGWTGEKQRQQVMRDIADIRGALQANQARLAEIEARYADAAGQVEGLARLVTGLQRTIQEQRDTIDGLTTTVRSLRAEIAAKDQEIGDKDRRIDDQGEEIGRQQEELAKAAAKASRGYFLIGSEQDLIRLGVLERKRGVLGLKKHRRLRQDFDKAAFIPIDVSSVREIPIPAGRRAVELLSPHPSSSYSLVESDAGTVLRIDDVEQFWQFRFAVIVMRN